LSNGEHIRLEELELFALGALPEEEAAVVRAHVAGCEECAAKLAQAHGSAAMLAFAVKQERPAGTIKAELMARIRLNREEQDRLALPSRTQAPGSEMERAKMVSDVKSSWWNWVLVPASVVLALVSFGLSLQNRKIAAELRKERQAAELLIQDREHIEKVMSVLVAPDTVTVKLAGMGEAASASGVVKYNGKTGIMVYSAELPELPQGKCYQLWLVPATGAPISAGVLGASGRATGNLWTAEVPANTEAKAFAVTIEAAGGAPQPTGPKVLLGTS
jgi:anti-sigma-K factor RskA